MVSIVNISFNGINVFRDLFILDYLHPGDKSMKICEVFTKCVKN